MTSRRSSRTDSRTGICSLGRHAVSAFALLSSVIIAAVVVSINADVAGRVFFDTPIRGVTEVVAISIPMIVFLAIGHLYAQNDLIRGGVLSRWFPSETHIVGTLLEVAFHGAAAGLSVFIFASTWPNFLRAYGASEFLGVAGDFTVPVWPAKLAVVIGSFLVSWMSLLGVLKTTISLWRHLTTRPGVLRNLSILCVTCSLVAGIPLLYLLIDSRAAAGGLSVALMLIFVYVGMPVAFALMSAAALGITAIKGDLSIAVNTLGLMANGAVFSYVFAAVPLFVLMGLIVAAADIGRDSLQAAHWVFRRIKGGLGVATVAANAVFAAVTGISIASAAIFSRVAVPPLIEHGYTPRFSVGLVAGSSVLGMLIPPSLLLIIYGLVAEVSINALFIAAIIPGLLLSGAFAVIVIVIGWLKPPFAIASTTNAGSGVGIDGKTALRKAIPVLCLLFLVLGGIYGGVFTPTEAGAIGALFAFLIALAMRRVGFEQSAHFFFSAARTSAAILFLIIAASAFGAMLTLSGIPGQVGAMVADADLGLSAYTLGYLVILILLGMVLDSTSILLITVPLALPAVVGLGGDLVWFGIVTVIGVELGLLTPPLGLSVLTIKSSLDDQSISLNDIFIGTIPFTLMMLAITLFLIAFPSVSLILL